jgi:predicted TPR repeat methyltransferase
MRDVARSPIGGGSRTAAFARQENIDAWSARREYPRIHDAMFGAFVSRAFPVDGAVLDIGCSTGLLGRRIADTGTTVVWADGDADATSRGQAAGIIGSLWLGRMNPDTWPDLCQFIRDEGVTLVVARRILCVLSDAVPTDQIADGFADAGVTAVLLEGQKVDGRSVQPNARADEQADYLADRFPRRADCGGDVRYCRQ